jgi:hypothetical protein
MIKKILTLSNVCILIRAYFSPFILQSWMHWGKKENNPRLDLHSCKLNRVTKGKEFDLRTSKTSDLLSKSVVSSRIIV